MQSVKLETLADCAAIFPRPFLGNIVVESVVLVVVEKMEGMKQTKHHKTSQ